jgi:hypothetical protein
MPRGVVGVCGGDQLAEVELEAATVEVDEGDAGGAFCALAGGAGELATGVDLGLGEVAEREVEGALVVGVEPVDLGGAGAGFVAVAGEEEEGDCGALRRA